MRGNGMRLPDFLVIGAEKGGTTWLYAVLKSMPELFLPATKEIHFFNRYSSNLEEIDRFSRLGLSWYARYFAACPRDQMPGEVTPMYLCDPDAPRRIAETLPEARLIASLREPGDRAYSHYWMARRKGHTRDTFEEVVAKREPRFLGRGLYGAQLRQWYEHVPRDRILVLAFEDTVAHPAEGLARLRGFLGLPAHATSDGVAGETVHGAARYRSATLHTGMRRVARWMSERPALAAVSRAAKRAGLKKLIDGVNTVQEPYPPMSDEMRVALRDYYAEDIALLESLLGRRMDAWHAPQRA